MSAVPRLPAFLTLPSPAPHWLSDDESDSDEEMPPSKGTPEHSPKQADSKKPATVVAPTSRVPSTKEEENRFVEKAKDDGVFETEEERGHTGKDSVDASGSAEPITEATKGEDNPAKDDNKTIDEPDPFCF